MQEESAGASYLAALKRSNPAVAASGAAAAPAPAPCHPMEGARPGDKRRSPRYPCQGSAHLREISSGAARWATFTDISLHGCYVEAMSTFPAGARVEFTLEVNGFRVAGEGEVRMMYSNLGMGIGFTALSDPDRERLRELLRSLSRPSVIMGAGLWRNASGASPPELSSSVPDPEAALQALIHFFRQRNLLTREEFARILRHSQSSGR